MYIMVQKSNYLFGSLGRVFQVFVNEPMKIHYIKEISRKIELAHTSVIKHLKSLEERGLIVREKGERFFGYKADRDSKDFLFYKQIFNLISIRESGFLDFIIDSLYPQAVVLYGSYLRGEDVEKSDIDLFVISNVRKKMDVDKFERVLKRRIHIIIEKNISRVNEELKGEINNGLVLYGYKDLENG